MMDKSNPAPCKEHGESGKHVVFPHPESAKFLAEMVVSSPDYEKIIDGLVKVIEEAERKVAEQKRVVNGLCETAGRPLLYSNIDAASSVNLGNIQPDQFYGQPLATAMRSILEMRKATGRGPATVREIYDTLTQGGFKFEAKDENALRGLRQSLTKNSGVFHKLPQGSYGLLEWYPNAKPARPDEADDD